MAKKSAKKPQPRIYEHHGLRNVLGETLVKNLRKRIDRKSGDCAKCSRTLGKADLALVAQLHEGDVRGYGDWYIAVTHRACQGEALSHDVKLLPRSTYRTALVALPVEAIEGHPTMVPTLLVNPSVDQFVIHKPAKGEPFDKVETFLMDECGFRRMSEDLADTETSEPLPINAYITGANVTVDVGGKGLSWTHEQPPQNAQVEERLADSLRALVEEWDGLFVMVSPQLNLRTDLQGILSQIPNLIHTGSILTANASPEFRATNLDLASKAFAAAHSPMPGEMPIN